ncbi:MAG: histidine--tRNA ligase [archaeon]|nr:histidine--tRNA ligase [archaeon]
MKFQTVRGMRDFLPEQAKKKQFIEDFIRKVFESYGFEPLQTPIVEDFELLAAKGSGGEAIKEEIYYFKDKGERELGLRYDLTVPLARVVASNPMLARPFKRYQISPVYRYDRPQAKRYREFTQADVDIVGALGVYADFECVQVAVDVMRGLGLDFKVRVNNRKTLEALAIEMGISKENIVDAFRSLDKLDKIGRGGVEKELKEKGIETRILGQIEANSFEEMKHYIKNEPALAELEELLELSKKNGYLEVEFDLSLARGLEYYTGTVFEIAISDGPSVGAGGRYDKLIGLYGGQETPATGISFGVDRLFDALEGSLVIGPNTDVFIIPIGAGSFAEGFLLASAFRKARVNAEIDLMGRNVKKNFEYANKRGISFAIVLGEDEVRGKKFKVKDLVSGEERGFSFGEEARAALFVKGRER